jgi:Kef-type K+ transport system membrane component KefB
LTTFSNTFGTNCYDYPCGSVFCWVFKKIGQPTVIGEIIAGIVLGPRYWKCIFLVFLLLCFPAESLGQFKVSSQIGLIFMFVIGMELDIKVLKKQS